MTVINNLRFITEHPINHGNKIASIMRFIKWQIGSRLIGGSVVFDWVNGSKFYVRRGETGLTGNIYTGLHEFQDMAFLLHFLRKEDLFIDVGANVGSYTILAGAAIGAKCYAFEPIPSTYQRLVENIRLNHLDDKVASFNIGLGGEVGKISFTSDMDTVNHVLTPSEDDVGAVTVDVSTLDRVLMGEVPHLIKIDVEGYETEVLNGAQKILSTESLKSVIMELNGSGGRYGFDESKILQMMIDFGFKSYSYDPMERTLVNLQGKNMTLGNTLFIRDEVFVLQRLRAAPKISIYGMSF